MATQPKKANVNAILVTMTRDVNSCVQITVPHVSMIIVTVDLMAGEDLIVHLKDALGIRLTALVMVSV